MSYLQSCTILQKKIVIIEDFIVTLDVPTMPIDSQRISQVTFVCVQISYYYVQCWEKALTLTAELLQPLQHLELLQRESAT